MAKGLLEAERNGDRAAMLIAMTAAPDRGDLGRPLPGAWLDRTYRRGVVPGALDASTLVLLVLGGIIYTAGVILHLRHRLPYKNAIWHGFVLVAASVQYAAVLGLVVDA